jgi:hypothetical protein
MHHVIISDGGSLQRAFKNCRRTFPYRGPLVLRYSRLMDDFRSVGNPSIGVRTPLESERQQRIERLP